MEERTKTTCLNRHVIHNFHVRNIDIFIAKLKSLAKSSGLYICPPTCLVLWLISNCSPIITDECLFTGYIALTKHNITNCPWKIKEVFSQAFSQQLLQLPRISSPISFSGYPILQRELKLVWNIPDCRAVWLTTLCFPSSTPTKTVSRFYGGLYCVFLMSRWKHCLIIWNS